MTYNTGYSNTTSWWYPSSWYPKIISNGGGSGANIDVMENTQFVTDVQTWDNLSSEANGLLKYSIVGGVDANAFTIDRHTGVLTFKTAPDFENPTDSGHNNIYDVVVKVTDAIGLSDTQSLWVKVTDKPENTAPEIIAPNNGLPTKLQAMENMAFVTNVDSKDADGDTEGNGLTYSIDGGGDASLFVINPDTGELSFKTAPDFEKPTDGNGDNIYDVDVKVTDSKGATDVQHLWVEVTDKPDTPASLGDKVFNDANANGIQDTGEAGVSGVKVTLTGGGADGVIGTADDTTATTTTNTSGMYQFTGLTPGQQYKATFSNLPTDFKFTQANAGTNDAADSDADPVTGMTQVVTLASGEVNNTLDAGIVKTVKPASLGDKVFNDANANGIQDTGEAGVSGVKVTLTGGGADGVIGTADDTTATTTTNTSGMYQFTGLTPGQQYKATFSNLPTDFKFTQANAGTNDAADSDADPTTGMTQVVTLASGEVNNTLDAGIFKTVQPTNSPPEIIAPNNGEPTKLQAMENMAFVTNVDSKDADGDTEGNGLTYSISGGGDASQFVINPNTGELSFKTAPDFEKPTDGNGDNIYDVNVKVTDSKGAMDTQNLWVQVTDKPETATLGDKVFNDANANGLQDTGEVGVSGIKVTLTGGGADGVVGTADDTTAMTTTNTSGKYQFTGLTPGKYKVTFSDLPADFEFTKAKVGTTDSIDSDADPVTGMTRVVTLTAGDVKNSLDAGIVKKAPVKVDINGTDERDTLVGTTANENIFGKGKADVLKGGGGDDCLFGGSGSDELSGDDGNDILNGTDSIALGVYEEDWLRGGAGLDRFVLGDASNPYYVGQGNLDCAVIEDFKNGEDKIQLHGSASDYQATFANGDTSIFKRVGTSVDLVAVVKVADTSNLNASLYEYV